MGNTASGPWTRPGAPRATARPTIAAVGVPMPAAGRADPDRDVDLEVLREALSGCVTGRVVQPGFHADFNSMWHSESSLCSELFHPRR